MARVQREGRGGSRLDVGRAAANIFRGKTTERWRWKREDRNRNKF